MTRAAVFNPLRGRHCRCGDCWLWKTAVGGMVDRGSGPGDCRGVGGSSSWLRIGDILRTMPGPRKKGRLWRRKQQANDFRVGRCRAVVEKLVNQRAAATNRFGFLSLQFRQKTEALRDEGAVRWRQSLAFEKQPFHRG